MRLHSRPRRNAVANFEREIEAMTWYETYVVKLGGTFLTENGGLTKSIDNIAEFDSRESASSSNIELLNDLGTVRKAKISMNGAKRAAVTICQ